MATVITLYQSSIGKKAIMAGSGLLLVLYVIVHMLANLKIYQGPAKINEYASFLREAGAPVFAHEQVLWLARIVLLVAAVLHIWAAYQLTRRDLESRPIGYQMKTSVASTYASRTMRWGGVIVLLFIIYHILHFTTGAAHPSFKPDDVYANVVSGFRVWYASLFYIVAMLALGLHLYHGVWSAFQTLGLSDSSRNELWRAVASAVAVMVTVGNISIPVAVMARIIP